MMSLLFLLRSMQILWIWCASQMESSSSSVDPQHLSDVLSAPRLWALMNDVTSHITTSIQKAPQRRGRCLRRPSTTTSCSSEEKSRGSILRALCHRQFQQFLLNIHAEYKDVVYHNDMRWLSRGSALQRFYTLRKEIGQFLTPKRQPMPEISDPVWLADFGFLVDITRHLNALNTSLQGQNAVIKLADNMRIGSNFEVNAILTNNCMKTKTCSFLFIARAVGYNGKQGESCGFASDKVEVPSGEERHLSLKLEYDSYGGVITSDRLIQLSAITIDKQTIDFHKAEKTIVLDEPEIGIKLLGEAKVNQPVTAHLTLLNSLPEPLQDCSFTIEGLGLTDGKPIGLKVGTVGPKEEAKADIEFRPSSAGPSMLLVNFDSNKLKNIKSFINIFVQL